MDFVEKFWKNYYSKNSLEREKIIKNLSINSILDTYADANKKYRPLLKNVFESYLQIHFDDIVVLIK